MNKMSSWINHSIQLKLSLICIDQEKLNNQIHDHILAFNHVLNSMLIPIKDTIHWSIQFTNPKISKYDMHIIHASKSQQTYPDHPNDRSKQEPANISEVTYFEMHMEPWSLLQMWKAPIRPTSVSREVQIHTWLRPKFTTVIQQAIIYQYPCWKVQTKSISKLYVLHVESCHCLSY